MNRTDAIREIKAGWRQFYPADKGGKGIICPCCGSGGGPHGTGISEMKNSRNHFLKCWNGGCDFNEGGSIIDLYMLDHGMNPHTEFNRAVNEMAEIIGIDIDDPGAADPQAGHYDLHNLPLDELKPQQGGKPAAPIGWDDDITQDGPGYKEATEEPAAEPETGKAEGKAENDPSFTGLIPETAEARQLKEDIESDIKAAEEEKAENPADNELPLPAGPNYYSYYLRIQLQNNPEGRAYYASRGISYEVAARYMCGYDPAFVNPKAIEALKAKGNSWRPDGTPAAILPSTYSHYVARDTRPDEEIPEKQQPYKKINVGSPELFGVKWAFQSGKENIFVTEGAFDALSIVEVGQAAIALNSTSNADKLIKYLEKNPTAATFIICLDNDPAGKKATEKLREGLRRLNISYITANINGTYKDPNEHLVGNRATFEAAIEKAIGDTAARPDSLLAYIENGGLVADIERRQAIGCKPTGFANLDAKICGGLRPGLFLMGAITSLGKTTFCSQMADGIAAAGYDVVYFSLEQSKLEMTSKCIARETAKIDMARAVTGQQIMDGSKAPIIKQAVKNYVAAVGERISIIEAGMNSDTEYMTNYVRNYYNRTGTRPVVFVDYLQILAPGELPNGRKQDKRETVEECLRQLVLLKRELDLTIIAIVSLNRSNYLQPFDFEAIKESGLCEYSADVIWGLQLQCLDDPLFTDEKKLTEKRDMIREAKAATPRKVKLNSLKHRGQQAIYECNFDYYPQFDLFIPTADTEAGSRQRPQRAGKKL